MIDVAAVLAAGLLAVMAVVQAALALGAPWGAHVYGGRVATTDGRLPSAYRGMSAVAVVVLAFAAWLILARAGVVGDGPLPAAVVQWGVWIVAGYLALNTLGNVASTSPVERWGFGALTLVAGVLTVIVAAS